MIFEKIFNKNNRLKGLPQVNNLNSLHLRCAAIIRLNLGKALAVVRAASARKNRKKLQSELMLIEKLLKRNKQDECITRLRIIRNEKQLINGKITELSYAQQTLILIASMPEIKKTIKELESKKTEILNKMSTYASNL